MRILAALTKNKNTITQSKCQKYYSINILIKILRMSKKCWFIKKSILNFYKNVYCDFESKSYLIKNEIGVFTELCLEDFSEICRSFDSEVKMIR